MPPLNENQTWLIDAVEGMFLRVSEDGEEAIHDALPFDVHSLLDVEGVPQRVKDFYDAALNPKEGIFVTALIALGAVAVGALGKEFLSAALVPVGQRVRALLPFEIADPGTLATKRRWTKDWDVKYEEYMLKHGFDGDHTDMMYFASLPRPGLGEILAGIVKKHGQQGMEGPSPTGYKWADEWLDEYVRATMLMPSVPEAVALEARHLISTTDAATLMERNNYDPTQTQFVRRMLEQVMSPAEVMRVGLRTHSEWGTITEELRRVQFDSHYDRALQELTFAIPGPLEQAQYFHRTGDDRVLTGDELSRMLVRPDMLDHYREMSWSIPGPSDIARHAHHEGLKLPQYQHLLKRVGFHPDYHELIDDLTLARPSPAEWFAFKYRMVETGVMGLDAMRELGYNPKYWNVWETLSHPMPGVQDLVTMAVREVFTPEVAEAFGQFEEIPEPYITNAAKLGLSEEWARNYWAAHWVLPSVMQGFDMRHRQVIDDEALGRLFVALDVMPYWRDKLTAISHRLLTRVDVRRMYREGVLTYDDTLQAYRHLGYSPLNAEQMTDFTVAYVRRQEVGYTRSQVLRAYQDRAIDHAEALDMLALLGIHGDDAGFALDMVDYDLATDLTDDRIKIVETSYKKGFIDRGDAGTQLDALEVPPEQKTLLLDRWAVVKAAKQRTFTKSEIMRYLVNGAINYTDAGRYLGDIGYSDDKIHVMLSDASMSARAVRGKRRQLSTADMVGMLAAGVFTIELFAVLLKDYGWRDPERCLMIQHIATAAGIELPEGTEPCDEGTILGMLSVG